MYGPSSLIVPQVDSRVWAAWQSQLVAAKQTPGLLPRFLQQHNALLPRFTTIYRQLRTLLRRVHRRLQRRWRQSLAGLALAPALSPGIGLADTLNVDGTTCTL